MGEQPSTPQAEQAARTPAHDRLRVVLDVVLAETAALLGQEPTDIDPSRPYLDYGYNSLAAVELTQQLGRLYGVELPLTMLFDQPTPHAVADYLLSRLGLPTAADATADATTGGGDTGGGDTGDSATDGGAAGSGATDAEPTRSKGRARADAVPPHAEDDPIAVVGMACRLPGGVNSSEELWRLVAEGRDAISGFPTDRGWNVEELYHPDPDHPGTTSAQGGGFIPDVADFDADFFGISPREALAMDPQQRLLLEGVWEAFENAGIDPESMRGSRTGVFAGVTGTDYAYLAHADRTNLQGYWGLGTLSAVASGRVAYTFGFQGPALTVDTACSSSLVATHLAIQSLRQGESTLAIAAGVTVMATPTVFIEFSRQRALSPDGRCRSFDATADGTGFSDGLAILLLERLSDAQHNGHHIHALIPGSAINQDGASNGMTAPNGPAQQRTITAALKNAHLTPHDIDAIEAHGTATTLGDPIEAQALHNTYAPHRPTHQPLHLGSLKSNIGHTQAAAGIAGTIKMITALHHHTLPPTLHITQPTPKINWNNTPLTLLTTPQPWHPTPHRPRRAAISSFGASGTNAHLILQEPPNDTRNDTIETSSTTRTSTTIRTNTNTNTEPKPEPEPDTPVVWPLSAKTPTALTAQAQRLHHWLTQNPHHHPTHIAHTLTTRTQHPHRTTLIGHNHTQLTTALTHLTTKQPDQISPRPARSRPGRVAFVFPGQGSQWPGMAAGLLEASPVFAEQLERCAEALAPHTDWNLLEAVTDPAQATALDRVDVVQPALFAVMVSLAALWRSYGVEPDAVVGHSQGEIAAACVAGALSLQDAARVVALRSQEIATLGGTGGMLSVARPVAEVHAMLAAAPGLSVAAVNSPTSVLVSGDSAALDAFHEDCVAEDVWVRRIPVDYASHSPHIESLRDRLRTVLGPVRPRAASVAFHSTVAAEQLDTTALDAEYWYSNLRNPVLFEETVRAMAGQGYGVFIEVSPHTVLTTALTQSLEPLGGDPVIAGSLTRDHGRLEDFLTSAGEAWEAGVPVDWSASSAGRPTRRVELPGYAFTRQRFWAGSGGDGDGPRAAGMKSARHPLLTGQLPLAGGKGRLFTGRVSPEELPWLADHTVFEEVVVPGTAVVELVASAGDRLGGAAVEELTLEAPLLLRDEAVGLQLHVQEPDAEGRAAFTVHAEDGAGGWTQHASGVLGPRAAARGGDPAAGPPRPPQDADPSEPQGDPPAGAVPLALDGLYGRLAERGMGYGRTFRGLRAAWRLGDDIHADVLLDDGGNEVDPRHLLHPALLDAAFHAAFAEWHEKESATALLPFAWSGVRLHRSERAPRALRVRLTPLGPDTLRMTGWDQDGRTVVTVDSVTARPVSPAKLAGARPAAADCLFAVDWTPAAPPADPVATDRMAILGPTGPTVGDTPIRSCPDLTTLPTRGEEAEGADTEPPAWLLVPVETPEGLPAAEAARATTHRVLSLLREWPAADRSPRTRLALLTRGAVAALPDEEPDPASAAVWGLVRSAQAEHPDTFALVDLGAEADTARLGAALAADEPQVALRDGALLVPRVARRRAQGAEAAFDPRTTVLVTGGTGGLGALVARHLATGHGVRNLLLASRRGMSAQGAPALVEELTGLGVHVRVAECDVSDRAAVAALLASVPDEHPLGAVVHAAGVLEDSLITSLTDDALDRVLRAKADSAWHLHELTAEHRLGAFVLFSSLAGVLGGPGQGNYAAANAFLDALAQARRAAGRPATSIAWGLWEQPGDMTGHLDASDTSRLADSGVIALSAEEGLHLLDATLDSPDPVVLAARLDLAAVRAQAAAGMAPPVLHGLVRTASTQQAATPAATVETLAGLSPSDRENEVLRLVRGEVAAVLRYPGADAVPPDRPLKDIGLDSLGAVQLRNRLNTMAGLHLPATVIFDHPTPRSVASVVLRELFGSLTTAAHDGTDPDGPEDAFDPAAGVDDLDAEELVRLALSDNRDDS